MPSAGGNFNFICGGRMTGYFSSGDGTAKLS